jgi:hypothetical protein
MKNELGSIWKEAVVVLFEAISRHARVGNEENREKLR